MEDNTPDHEPATKGDVRALGTELCGELATKTELTAMEQRLHAEIKATEGRIVHEFQVVAENIHKDVAGANADWMSGLETTKEDHEERLTTLEKRAGLRVE